MLETKSIVAETIKNTDGVEIKIDSAALVSWLFLFGSLLLMLDAGLEIIQGISIHSIIHISASLLFTVGSILFLPIFSEETIMKFTAVFKKLVFVAIISMVIITVQFGVSNFQNITAQAGQISHGDTEFQQLIHNSLEAWNTNKPENLAKFYAQEPELKFFDALPMQYQGWKNYQAGIQKNLFDNMPKFKLKANDDIQTHRRDNVAWTT